MQILKNVYVFILGRKHYYNNLIICVKNCRSKNFLGVLHSKRKDKTKILLHGLNFATYIK